MMYLSVKCFARLSYHLIGNFNLFIEEFADESQLMIHPLYLNMMLQGLGPLFQFQQTR